MRTPSNSRFVRARLAVLGVAAAVLAAVLVPTVAASAAPSAAPTPAPTHHVLAMGTFSAKDYAGQAAHLPGGLAAALKRDLHETPAQYLADSAAAVHAVKVIASLKSAGVHVLGSKISGTDLTVNVASTADKAAVTASGATAVVGAPTVPNLHKTTLHTDTATVTPAYGGEGYFFQTTAQLTTGYITLCSIGFNGYSTASGSAPQFVTAGHCATTISNTASGGTGANLYTQTAPTNNGGTRNTSSPTFLGNTVAGEAKYAQDTNDDYGIVASGSSVVPQAALYTWGGGGGAPLSSAPLPVQGETAAVVGANLCKSGATTGWTCGSVIAVDDPTEVCPDGVSQCPDNYVNAILATTCALPGDSGSGAVIGTFAAGIDSGGNYGSSCANPYSATNPNGNFSAFFPMVTTPNTPTSPGVASIDGQVGTSWKLLAAPLVTSPAPGASITANSTMTGTLFNPLAGTQVALFLDGSSTPLAQVSAASGTWSIPLTGITQGVHSYNVGEFVGGNQIASVPGTFVYRQAGTLIKGSAANIYMADGVGGIIPISSFSVPADMGLSTSYVNVSDAEIQGDTVAPSPLSNLVSCAGIKYLAGQSKLWPVGSGAIGSLPVEALPATLCAQLSISTTSLPSPTFIKGSPATVYELVNGQKDATTSSAQVQALAGTANPVVLTINDGYVGSIPNGPTLVSAGSLIKTASNPAIYLVDGSGGVIPVASFGTVSDLGLSTNFTTVADATVTGATMSPTALANLVSCGGTKYFAAQGKLWAVTAGEIGSLPVETFPSTLCAALTISTTPLPSAVFIKGSAANIYELNGGQKDPVAAYSQMVTLAAPNAPSWLTINDTYIASIPTGPTLVTPGSLVKGPSAPNIYLVDGSGGLIPVASFGTVSDLGLPTSYITVSQATITNISATTLSNLVSCGGTTYLAAQGQLWAVTTAVVGSLPVETLPATLCAVVPVSTTPLPSAVFIKGSAANIYQFTGGKKDSVTAYSQLVALSAPHAPTWLTINDTYLAAIPSGPALVTTGSLVKGSSASIYMVDGSGGLIPVASFGTVSDLGLSTSYSNVSDATISGSTIAASPLSNLVSCGGVTYLAVGGALWQIGSGQIGSLPVETLPASLCAVIPKSASALPNPVFIKGSAANIYELTGGQKDPITSVAQWQALAGTSSPTAYTLNDYFVGTIPVGSLS